MANIVRYDPFREAIRLSDAMNQLFEQSFVRPSWITRGENVFATPVDVKETEQGYEVKAQLAGVKPEDIELTVQDNTLTLKAQYNEEKNEEKANWKVREIRRGSFVRTIRFDKEIDADKITTSYENGVLTLTAPYSEANQPKRISVTANK